MPESLMKSERPRVPLYDAAGMLAELCDRLDAGEEPSQAFVSVFKETSLDLADAVDRRIAFDVWVKGAISAAKHARDEWATRSKQLEALHEAFKENTRLILVAHPDLPYQGSLGRIAVQKSPPKLHLAFFDKAVTRDMITHFGIDEKYIKTEVTYSIDTDQVKADLLSGEEIPWAALEQGTHVRFRK